MADLSISMQRLWSQRIEGDKHAKPEEVVQWMGAMQAQNYSQALWAIGQRMQNATLSLIEKAIAEKKIIRTWPMRGTLHFIAPEDIRWMLNLSAERLMSSNKGRLKQLELDEATLERCKLIFYHALKDGRPLSRPYLMKLLEESGISTQNQRGPYILWYASQTSQICQGPMQANQQTFALIEDWAPHAKELSRDESLYELAKRYFLSHGPATVHDFSWWASLTVVDAKRGMEAAKPELAVDKLDSKEYGMAPNQMAIKNSSFQLLPGFDEYLLGYKDRSAVLSEAHTFNVIPGKNGVFLPTIVADSQIMGTWKRTPKKKTVELILTPFASLEKKLEEKAAQAAEAYSSFLELPLSSLTVHEQSE
ncbi:winged helix DNA-binding domain-containing protein [Planococcus sp. N028]|uniref:Winged helix DNA-binding domain-containing protein n=1 Tax=Planococcus shixiaomingii TaxID=3058393 RepID=A0ABT8N4I9_9BACL|nr:winged helix DNA-binding domain-containing protein [Planococcus sp. N028]MDN7242465.1 winged helix DNA-binding domain-containing protein [Planococcus sp. N028]